MFGSDASNPESSQPSCQPSCRWHGNQSVTAVIFCLSPEIQALAEAARAGGCWGVWEMSYSCIRKRSSPLVLHAAEPRTQPRQQTVSQLPAGLSTLREGRQRTGRNKPRQEFLLEARQYPNFLLCHGSGTLLGGGQANVPPLQAVSICQACSPVACDGMSCDTSAAGATSPVAQWICICKVGNRSLPLSSLG